MELTIHLPYRIFAEISHVSSIVAETNEGSFGLLLHRMDCVAAIVPSIFSYKTADQTVHYLAVDTGILIKMGNLVFLSVRNAFASSDLAQLHESVENEYKLLDKTEMDIRASMAKMESGFLYKLEKFQNE